MKAKVKMLNINEKACAIMQLGQNCKVARFTQLCNFVQLLQVARGDVDYQRFNPQCNYATLKSKKDEKGQLGDQSGKKCMPNRTFTK